MKDSTTAVKKSASVLKKMCGARKPCAYIISGSGQKGLPGFFRKIETVSFKELAGYVSPTVKGHAGEISLCAHKNRFFLLQCGRSHLYERNDLQDVLLPLLVVKQLGIGNILLLNSAGAVNRSYKTGDIMVIKDHINLMLRNPLFGDKSLRGNERFVAMRPCYDPAFIHRLRKKKGFSAKFGVYAGVMGPCYETEAELNMLEKMHADVVGMSTVQEAVYARYLGLSVSGISIVANARKGKTDHDDIIRRSDSCLENLSGLIKEYIFCI
jgi:purine-nucleoside phosphorylase